MPPRPSRRAERLHAELAASHGVLSVRTHPWLRRELSRGHVAGEVVRVLPGTYVAPDAVQDAATLVRAVVVCHPDAVVVGLTAARARFWKELPGSPIEVAHVRSRSRSPLFRFTRTRIPPQHVLQVGAVRLAAASWTAVDLAPRTRGESLDTALRQRHVTLASCRAALAEMPRRRGNRQRRRLVRSSRGNAWSPLEREAHEHLWRAGLHGWVGNRETLIDGQRFFVDIAFVAEKVAVEIDGRLHDTRRDIAVNDRRRQNLLELDGWLVLRFTAEMLRGSPELFVEQVRRALRRRRRRPG